MFKRIQKNTTYLLVLLLMLNATAPLVVYVSFQANKAYIIENFCKNKDKPTLACNGQCVLMKKLKALDIEKKKSDSEQIKVSFLSFKFLHNIIFTVCNIFILIEKNTHFFDYNNYHFFFLSDIFTPPQS